MGGRQSKPVITELDRTVADLKGHYARLQQTKAKIRQLGLKNYELACQNIEKPHLARTYLRLRQYHMHIADQLDRNAFKLYQIIQHIEMASLDRETVAVLSKGALVLKQLRGQFASLESIQGMVTAIGMGVETQNWISTQLATNLSPEDQRDIESEWEALAGGSSRREESPTQRPSPQEDAAAKSARPETEASRPSVPMAE